jgi:hypothetical protein
MRNECRKLQDKRDNLEELDTDRMIVLGPKIDLEKIA